MSEKYNDTEEKINKSDKSTSEILNKSKNNTQITQEIKTIKKNEKKAKKAENPEKELEQALETIPSNTEFGKQTDKLTQNIENNPDLKDPENKNIVQKLIESLKSGDISGAFTSLFSFLKGVMGPGDQSESIFWFKDNKKINEFLDWLSKNVDTMSVSELENQKNKFLGKIESTQGVKKKLGLTYALSRLLDEIVVKKDSNKKRIKGSIDGGSNRSANELSIARMSQQIKPGDVLAVNKSEQKLGDKLLTQLADDDLNSSHVLIVTAVDPESGKVTVAHSTGSKVNSAGKGVETNLDLAQYTNQFHGIAIATLRPPQEILPQLLSNVQEKDGKGYDEGEAASTALLGSNLTKNNDKYNCVELIAQSFPDNISSKWKDRTHPSQMLKTLPPVYVAVAGKSIGGS